jgi:hypothetical protein
LNFLLAGTATLGAKALVNLDTDGLALQGYDPVALFTDARPVVGDAKPPSQVTIFNATTPNGFRRQLTTYSQSQELRQQESPSVHLTSEPISEIHRIAYRSSVFVRALGGCFVRMF